MVSLVSLPELKQALHIDHSDDDNDLDEMLIPAASEAIIAYLKSGADAFLTSGGDAIDEDVPMRVKRATIMLVSMLYDGDFKEQREAFSHGNLPFTVTSMIYQLRDPALA